MTPIELTSELSATLTNFMGTDRTVIEAARVSTQTDVKEGDEKLIDFLIRNRHASPVEHCTATFLISCPIFVAREHMRHRTQSFNEVSSRYSVLKPKFYAPNSDRALIQKGKPGAYTFSVGEDEDYTSLYKEQRFIYQSAWDGYERLLERGIAKEVARNVLPLAIYTSFYATANLRNWLNYLSLRAEEHALAEIRDIAFQIEHKLYELFPVTLESWDRSNRGPL